LRQHFAEMNQTWRLYPDIRQLARFQFYGWHMRYKYYNAEDMNLLIQRDVIIENDESMNYYFRCHFLIDESKNVCRGRTGDLTDKFYANELFPSLLHYHLKSVWQEFEKRSVKQQLLEEAIDIFLRWYYLRSHSPTDEMNEIVQQVMEHLKIKYSKHPLFSISNEQFSYWKCNNIEYTEWNDTNGRQILDSLCEVSRFNFHQIQCYESNNLQENVHR